MYSIHLLTISKRIMKMEVEILSKEYVKPSSPTPSHLRTFKLSLLDQFIPSPYAPIILFYSKNEFCPQDDISSSVKLLKKSLSETLTSYYPLAGKLRDHVSIDCDDGGAYYVEARVNCHLSEFLSQPDVLQVYQFLPCEQGIEEIDKSIQSKFVAHFQVNVFKCGGIAIGICVAHKILDGVALSTFLKSWSTTARGDCEPIHPSFIASSLFPSNGFWLKDAAESMWCSLMRKGNSLTRRFVFKESAIASLRAEVTNSTLQHPTRVEVVSAFLWKCAMAASKEKHGLSRPSLITHLVNLRSRCVPPFSDRTTGNFLWIAAAQTQNQQGQEEEEEEAMELRVLVSKLREAITGINGDYRKNLQSDQGKSEMKKYLREIGERGSQEETDHLGFTSWCKFGYYEVDFGWGSPVWVSCTAFRESVFMNLVVLVDTPLGDGIEAWVTMDEERMAIMQKNSELLSFASLDPSPLALSSSLIS